MNEVNPTLQRLFFNITSGCNLHCSYCYLAAKPQRSETLPVKVIEKLAYDAKKCGAKSVVLSGGEPFFRKDWFDVFAAFNQLEYQLAVSSNGCLINKKAVERLLTLNNLIFQISLDGCDATVDRLAGVKGTFARVDAGIARVLDAGYEVQLNCVLQKENLLDLPFLIRYASERQIILRLTLLDVNYGRALSNRGALSLGEISRVIKAMHLARTAYRGVELNLPPLLLNPDDWFPISPSCGWMHHQCGVLSNGDVTVCGLASERPDLVAGNITQQSFEEIWYGSPFFNKLRHLEVKQIKGVCRICPFLEVCGGSCRLSPYVSSGDFYAPNSLCQAYYDALKAGEINEVDFPSGLASLGLMGNDWSTSSPAAVGGQSS